MIAIHIEKDTVLHGKTAILVPDIALSEAGHIRTLSADAGPQDKHAFFAIAQTAYMQFQDEELKVSISDLPMMVTGEKETVSLQSGLVIVRTVSGEIKVLAHSQKPHGKLLEAAYRYCTRWVRLDI